MDNKILLTFKFVTKKGGLESDWVWCSDEEDLRECLINLKRNYGKITIYDCIEIHSCTDIEIE